MATQSLNSRYVSGHDGTQLFVEFSELRGDVDIILCDGIGCDGFIWTQMMASLANIGRVIHPHMRGHGRSNAPLDMTKLTIRDFALDLESMLQTLPNPDRPLLILGHSMGVQVALEFIRQKQDRVTGAILICGSFEHPANSFHFEDKLARALPMLKKVVRRWDRPISAIWNTALKLPLAFTVAKLTETHPDRTDRSVFEPYLAHLADMDLNVFFTTLSYANEHSARAYLSDLKMPVLVVTGEDDRMTPPHLGGELAHLLPNSEYYGVTDATHIAPIEFPGELNARLERFYKKILGASN